MSRKLRSNLEPGTALWAGRRAQWRALGISDEDMAKPKIAIVNSSSELSSCFSHLDGVADDLKIAIRGGRWPAVRSAHRGAERLHYQCWSARSLYPSDP